MSWRSAVVLAALVAVAAAAPVLPLSTSGRWIVDSAGKRVKLACFNWYGAESVDFVVGGLAYNTPRNISRLAASLGFNCVRLPWSVQLVLSNPVVSKASVLTAAPELVGKRALDILDVIVKELSNAGLLILLDNHVSRPDWCCSEDDGNGLWFTSQYDEAAWISSWRTIVSRYASVPNVVGCDLRNELRSAVVNGQRLTPVWGGNGRTDWRAAAQRCAAAIHQIKSTHLIIVEGLSYSVDLRDVYHNPANIPRVVYGAHDYSWFNGGISNYEQYAKKLGDNWGYIVSQGRPFTAPVWVNEFGTCHGGGCYGNWWQWCLRYLANADFDWAYWSLDGTQSNGAGRSYGNEESFGILNKQWNAPASKEHIGYLQSIMKCKENCN